MAETAATSAAAVRGGADQCALWFRVVRWTAAFGLAVLMLVGYTLMSTWNIDRFTDGHATVALLWGLSEDDLEDYLFYSARAVRREIERRWRAYR